MKRIAFLAILPVLIFTAFAARAGEPFPDLVLEGNRPGYQDDYLGLTSDSPTLSEIRTKFVLVEIMSMYCPICQREAPLVNEIFQYLDDRGYSGRIKMIAIAAGNSQFEVDFFRNKYSIPMPMFTDRDYKAHKAVGGVGTPYYFLVKLREDGRLESVFSHEGAIDDKDRFIESILAAAGYRE